MKLMKARWCFVGALGIAAVAFGFARTRAKDSSVAAISAEPAAPVAAEPAQASNAGIAFPLATTPTPRPARTPLSRKAQDKTSLELDTIEPWTGEDLAPVLVAARGGRPKFERVDPWDPNVVHEVNPANTMPVDENDPWDEVVSLKKKPAPPKTQVALEKTSPWGDETPATSL